LPSVCPPEWIEVLPSVCPLNLEFRHFQCSRSNSSTSRLGLIINFYFSIKYSAVLISRPTSLRGTLRRTCKLLLKYVVTRKTKKTGMERSINDGNVTSLYRRSSHFFQGCFAKRKTKTPTHQSFSIQLRLSCRRIDRHKTHHTRIYQFVSIGSTEMVVVVVLSNSD
jgi:hypothetical protein